MAHNRLILPLLLVGIVARTLSLSCRCPQQCSFPPPGHPGCTYGLVDDECFCCKECGKGPNEECGSVISVGNCGCGMTCEQNHHNPNIPGHCVDNWTSPSRSCIIGHNTNVLDNIATLRDCICECENAHGFFCQSVEYHSRSSRCVLSDTASNSNPSRFRQHCPNGGWQFTELKPVDIPPSEFTIGTQTFVVLDGQGTVTWDQAKRACSAFGFGYSLAEPENPESVAAYLKRNYPGLTFYWLGGRGVGQNVKWNSGIDRFSHLWRTDYETSSAWCVYLKDDGGINPLGSFNCQDTTYLYPLCEATFGPLPPLPPAPPAAFPAAAAAAPASADAPIDDSSAP